MNRLYWQQQLSAGTNIALQRMDVARDLQSRHRTVTKINPKGCKHSPSKFNS